MANTADNCFNRSTIQPRRWEKSKPETGSVPHRKARRTQWLMQW
jgi:hypothetical protein